MSPFLATLMSRYPGLVADLERVAEVLWAEQDRFTGFASDQRRMDAVAVRRAVDVLREVLREVPQETMPMAFSEAEVKAWHENDS